MIISPFSAVKKDLQLSMHQFLHPLHPIFKWIRSRDIHTLHATMSCTGRESRCLCLSTAPSSWHYWHRTSVLCWLVRQDQERQLKFLNGKLSNALCTAVFFYVQFSTIKSFLNIRSLTLLTHLPYYQQNTASQVALNHQFETSDGPKFNSVWLESKKFSL